MSSYLHGINIEETAAGLRPFLTPDTCVIAVVDTAPVHLLADASKKTLHTPVLINSDTSAAAYAGPDRTGYGIPNALAAILEYGSAQVVMVNVFDPATHKTTVATESVVLGADGTVKLAHGGILSATVKNQAGTTTYVKDTDYTLDADTGTITRKTGGAIAAGATLTVAPYEYADPSKVTAADVIGGPNAAGKRTGLQALLDVPSLLGIKPRIILCPGWSTQQSVVAAMTTLADKLKAHSYVDAPIGTTVDQAIAGRGTGGTINFATSAARAVLCFPFVMVALAAGGMGMEPLSQNLAGLTSYVHASGKFWESPSNRELRRVQALERPIQWVQGDSNCEANLLNQNGIVTAVRPFGSGFRAWGNRSAAWPTDTHPLNFISVRVVADILHEAIERASLPFLDRALDATTLDAIREMVQQYIDSLVQKGALLGGSITWSAADNPEGELALGHAVFQLSFLPPIPMEKVTFRSAVDTAWLRTLWLAA